MAKRDYYEVLGVSRNASDADIKKAYRTLAKQHHPDVNNGDANAEAKFKEIGEAYEVLSDPQKRARYDQVGHETPGMGGADPSGFGGFSGGFGGGLEDLIDAFFGGGMGGGATQRRRGGPERGADLRYDLTIQFEEAAFGAKKEISIARNESCGECGGSGAKPGTQPKTCTVCGGSGQVRVPQNTVYGRFVNVHACDACKGEGTIISDPCTKCNGRGRVRATRKIVVNVPAGIDNGQALPLRGEGEPGVKGGPAGDLYININVRPHKLFTRQNDDLYCEMNITFAQATLGGEVEVPTLEGKVRYNVPEGTQPGTKVRLKGKGITSVRGSGKGDLYITLRVEVPKRLTDQQRELLRQFDAALGNRELKADGSDAPKKRKGLFGL